MSISKVCMAVAMALSTAVSTERKTLKTSRFKMDDFFKPLPPSHENGNRIDLNNGGYHNKRNNRKTKGKRK